MTDKTKTTKKLKSFKELNKEVGGYKPKVTKREAQKHWYPSRNDKRYDFKEE